MPRKRYFKSAEEWERFNAREMERIERQRREAWGRLMPLLERLPPDRLADLADALERHMGPPQFPRFAGETE